MAKTAPAAKPGTNVVSLKERMKQEVATLSSRTAPPSGDNISITQDKHFKLPNGSKHPGPLSVIIVDFMSKNEFYEGAYDPNNMTSPACFAIGQTPTTMAPSPNAPVPQSKTCTGCPMNEFGSAGKGKACKNMRVLAVLPPDADADEPLAIIKVSPTALKSFDGYVNSVAQKFGVPPLGVVTELSFDPNQTYATLRFGNPTPCSEDQLTVAFARKDEARKRLEVEPDVSRYVAPVAKGKKVANGRR